MLLPNSYYHIHRIKHQVFGRACVFLHSHRRKEKPWSMLPRAGNTNSAVTKWGEQRWNWWKALLRDLAVALVLSSCCFFYISTEFLKDLSGCGCVDRDEPITPKNSSHDPFQFSLGRPVVHQTMSCKQATPKNKCQKFRRLFEHPLSYHTRIPSTQGPPVEEISYD